MIFLAQSSTPAKQRCDAALKCTIYKYICSSGKLWRHKNTAQPDPYFTCIIHTITHDTSITAKHEPRKTPRRTIERVYRDGNSAMRDRSSCVLVLLLILPGSLCDDDHGDLVSDSARYAKKCADWWTELLDLKRATKFVWARPNARSRVSCEPEKKRNCLRAHRSIPTNMRWVLQLHPVCGLNIRSRGDCWPFRRVCAVRALYLENFLVFVS